MVLPKRTLRAAKNFHRTLSEAEPAGRILRRVAPGRSRGAAGLTADACTARARCKRCGQARRYRLPGTRQQQCGKQGLTPELSRPAKRVRLGRTVMRAKVNPKPATRNGSGGAGGTEEASARTEQVEASKDRSRERRQSVSHEAILCRAARAQCVRSRVKRSRGARTSRTHQRAINAEASGAAGVDALPKPTTPTHLPTHNA